jgi:hypothetical protein
MTELVVNLAERSIADAEAYAQPTAVED